MCYFILLQILKELEIKKRLRAAKPVKAVPNDQFKR